MRVRHPYAGDADGVPPAIVDVNGDRVPVDEDGIFEVADESWVRRFADAHDTTVDAIVVDGDQGDSEITVDEVEQLADEVIADRIDAGECPWCDEYSGDAVGQHAASAHPDAWDEYKEDS